MAGPILNHVKNKRKMGRIYSALGTLFCALGAIMIVIAASAWHANQTLAWQVMVYALINLLAGYGFFTKSSWLLPGFAATIGGLAFLILAFTAHYGTSVLDVSSLVKVVVVGLILWFIYSTRSHLRPARHDAYVGGLFIFLILSTMSYTALTVLS